MRPTLSLLMLVVISSGCSIEHTRRLGENCVQDRECARGLVCLPSASGDPRTVCQLPPTGNGIPPSDGRTDAIRDVMEDAVPDARDGHTDAMTEVPGDSATSAADAARDDADGSIDGVVGD